MNTTKDGLREFLKEEFEHAAFMADLGKHIPRNKLFDMFLRTDNAIIWSIVTDCLSVEATEKAMKKEA